MVIKKAAFFLSLSFSFFTLSLTFSGLNVSNIFFSFFSFLIYYVVLLVGEFLNFYWWRSLKQLRWKIAQFLLVANFEIIALENGSIFIGRGL
jgi:hypothetical protein